MPKGSRDADIDRIRNPALTAGLEWAAGIPGLWPAACDERRDEARRNEGSVKAVRMVNMKAGLWT